MKKKDCIAIVGRQVEANNRAGARTDERTEVVFFAISKTATWRYFQSIYIIADGGLEEVAVRFTAQDFPKGTRATTTTESHRLSNSRSRLAATAAYQLFQMLVNTYTKTLCH